jgi:nitrite reductase (NADH) large subunit
MNIFAFNHFIVGTGCAYMLAVSTLEKENLVVIGNGMAGARFVEELLSRGGRDFFEIVMFGDEPYGNYSRILLSGVLAGSHEPKEIFLNPLQWYTDNGITLHAGVCVESIDREARTVHGTDGVIERYDRLVFATGAKPFIPPIRNLASETGSPLKEGIFLFRTLDDSLRIMQYAKQTRKAVVIGGGLLGLEAARGLLNQGLEGHVAELMPYPMAIQLDPPAGGALRATVEEMGIRFHLGKSVAAAIGNGHIEGVTFSDGTAETCETLVTSAGIRPNVDIAKAAGLHVGRGIIVGDDLACTNGRFGLPSELCRIDGEGCGCSCRRRRPLGNLCRRRRGFARAKRRCAMHPGHTRRRSQVRWPVHPVLPREWKLL